MSSSIHLTSSNGSSSTSGWTSTMMDHPTLLELLPGAAQGATQVFLGHPVDTVKTRIQSATTEIGNTSVAPNSRKGLRFTTPSTLTVLMQMVREEGVTSLYRGVTPPLLLTAAKRSLQFALWENLHNAFEGSSLVNIAPGAIAGFAGTVIGCPVHVIKIQTQNSRAKETKNALTCFGDILKNEGLRGLYRGMYAQIIKDTCFAAMYLGLYGILRDQLVASQQGSSSAPSSGSDQSATIADKSVVEQGDGKRMVPFWDSENAWIHQNKVLGTFLAGTVASTCTWILLAPLDTFKTFVQSKRNPLELWASLRSSGTSGGQSLRVLWRGLPAALFRSGPVAGSAMIAYEGSRSFLSLSDAPMVKVV